MKKLLSPFLISLLLIFLALFFFKKMRAISPVSEITSDGLIGFSQYFGYPLYFDTLLFLFIFMVPFVVFYIFKKVR